MKKLLAIALLTASLTPVLGQSEKEVKSTITDVTIYSQGAQIFREAKFDCPSGTTVIRLTGLTPWINVESIRVDGDGTYTINGVQHQNDYLTDLENSEEAATLLKRIEELERKVIDEETSIKVCNEKLEFLRTNRSVTAANQSVNPESFNQLNTIYGTNVEKLTFEILTRTRTIATLREEIGKLRNQLQTLQSRRNLPSGNILVTVNASRAVSSKMKISYMTNGASWEASYDIRFNGIDKPVGITRKANIRQSTGIDWKDVGITLSTSKSTVPTQLPELLPDYLRFSYPEVKSALAGRAAGVEVYELEDAAPMAESIRIRGASSMKQEAEPLYVIDGVPQIGVPDISPEMVASMNVIKDASATSLYGSRASNGVVVITTRQPGEAATMPLTVTGQSETIHEYFINGKQSVKSDNMVKTINFMSTESPAIFEYQSVPKLVDDVYLVGRITGLENAEMMSGEANIYLEESYVGKIWLNTAEFTDTLNVSFGVDNNLLIKREKLTDFTKVQTIGQNRRVTRAYRITIRNTKPVAVKAIITDQVPVSTIKDIEVELIDISGAKHDTDFGKLTWEVELAPGASRELIISYAVKYPKNQKLIID